MAGGQRSKDLVCPQVAVEEDKVWNRAQRGPQTEKCRGRAVTEGAQGNSRVNRCPEEEKGEEGVERVLKKAWKW